MLESQFELRGWRWPVTSLAVLACLCALGPIVFDLEQGLPLSLQSLLVCWLPLMLGWRAGCQSGASKDSQLCLHAGL